MTKNFKKGKIVACLDIGSSKVVCLIASINSGHVEILGYGHKESKGIVGSVVSDMKMAQKAITSVVAEAERMAGLNIDKLLVGISGNQVKSTRRDVSVKVASDIVKFSDIGNLANMVRSEFRKKNREIIHLIPLQYNLDDLPVVENPRYMSGDKLHAKFHVVSTSYNTVRNIENCLKRCQLSINSYVVEPYASSLSCLTENENNLGTLLIDIGGSSTSFCVIISKKLFYVGSSNIGGIHITKDISTILNIKFELAEKIKSLNNSLLISPLEEKELIKLKILDFEEGPEMVNINRLEFRDIIKARLEEMFELTKESLQKAGIPLDIIGNVVLTGGVTSTVGIDRLASEIFGKNVRIGYPTKPEGIPSEILNPTYSSCLGMMVFLKNMYLRERIKDGFEVKNSWFRQFIEKLAAI
ncbi:MAG: cell division protein FtsA [Pelagibacterales bacterium]|nr:cell division protein FtsA [Pelagibacterales bacterium]